MEEKIIEVSEAELIQQAPARQLICTTIDRIDMAHMAHPNLGGYDGAAQFNLDLGNGVYFEVDLAKEAVTRVHNRGTPNEYREQHKILAKNSAHIIFEEFVIQF